MSIWHSQHYLKWYLTGQAIPVTKLIPARSTSCQLKTPANDGYSTQSKVRCYSWAEALGKTGQGL